MEEEKKETIEQITKSYEEKIAEREKQVLQEKEQIKKEMKEEFEKEKKQIQETHNKEIADIIMGRKSVEDVQNNVLEVEAYYLIDANAASNVRKNAMDQALQETATEQIFGTAVDQWVRQFVTPNE